MERCTSIWSVIEYCESPVLIRWTVHAAVSYSCSLSSQTNTFQGIVTTDHMRSFTVFSYKCGDIRFSNSATIGFTAGDVLFANHPFTLRRKAQDIACINSPESEWVNVVYELTSEDLQPPNVTGKPKLWMVLYWWKLRRAQMYYKCKNIFQKCRGM